MEIKGRIACITGTKRIGGTVGFELAEKGAKVALIYNRSKQEAETVAKEIRAIGKDAITIQADLAQAIQVKLMVSQVIKIWGGIDFLINLASIYTSSPLLEITEDDWDNNMNINLRSAFFCAQAVAPAMRLRGGGHIINCTDWTAASNRPRYRGYIPYYVSKIGIIGLTESLALEMAPENILVNAIAPGPIVPPPDLSQEKIKKVQENTPLGRWGGAEEIAKVVLNLVESDFITGECIRVDGGRHIF